MASRWDSLASYFLVVGAGDEAITFDPNNAHLPIAMGGDTEDKENACEKSKEPITSIMIISSESQIPEGYEVAGIISNKRHIAMLSGVTMSSADLDSMECVNEYSICVSRSPDEYPITQLVYTTAQGQQELDMPPGFEMIESPSVNLTPTGDVDTIWNLYARREGSRVPIMDVLVEPDEEVLQRMTGTTKVENATFSRIKVDLFVRYVEEFPRLGVTYVPRILSRFPQKDAKDCSVPPAVTGFCFPNGVEFLREAAKPLFFPFVLTDEQGAMQYGSCYVVHERRSFVKHGHTRVFYEPRCLCILSRWPFFCSFRRFHQSLFALLRSPCPYPIESYIVNLFEASVPPQGDVTTQLIMGDNTVDFARPASTDFPLANYSLLPLFHSLDLPNIATVLCLILTEAKLLIQSQHLSLLTPICESLTSLIFPLRWQHIYVPLCPPSFLDFLQAPVPFIIGVQTGVVDFSVLPTDVYLVDIDNNRIQKKKDEAIDDTLEMPSLPAQSQFLDRLYSVASHLFIKGYTSMENIENHPYTQPGSVISLHKTAEQVRQEAIRESFLDFFVSILRPYREFLTIPTADTIHEYSKIYSHNPEEVFNKAGFLESIPCHDQRFMTMLVDSQAFTHFVEQRSFISNRDEELLFFDMCIDEANLLRGKHQVEEELCCNNRSFHSRMTSTGSARNLINNISQSELFAGRSAVDIRSWASNATSNSLRQSKIPSATSTLTLSEVRRKQSASSGTFSPKADRSAKQLAPASARGSAAEQSSTPSRPGSRETKSRDNMYGIANSPVASVRVQPAYSRPHVVQMPQLPDHDALIRLMPSVLDGREDEVVLQRMYTEESLDSNTPSAKDLATAPFTYYNSVFPTLHDDLFPPIRQSTRFNADALHTFDKQSSLYNSHHASTKIIHSDSIAKSLDTRFENEASNIDEISTSTVSTLSTSTIPTSIPSPSHTSSRNQPVVTCTVPDTDIHVFQRENRLKAQAFFVSLHEIWLYLFSVRMSSSTPTDVPAAFKLADSVLDRMREVNIRPSEGCYRLLLVTCARQGGYAAQARSIFAMMSRDGIVPNAITTGLFVRANLQQPTQSIVARYPSLPTQTSTSVPADQPQQPSAQVQAQTQSHVQKAPPHSPALHHLFVQAKSRNEYLPMHLAAVRVLAQSIVESNNICPNCATPLSDEEIALGWDLASHNTNTVCVHCHIPFVPELQYSYTMDSVDIGSDGSHKVNNQETDDSNDTEQLINENFNDPSNLTNRTEKCTFGTMSDRKLTLSPSSDNQPLTQTRSLSSSSSTSATKNALQSGSGSCPYLSPTVLFRELDIAFYRVGFDANTDPQLDVNLHRDHPILFWNVTWYFAQLRLPIELSPHTASPRAHMQDRATFQGFDEPAIRYSDSDATLRVHMCVNGLSGRFAGVPFCRARAIHGLPDPMRVNRNKHGSKVVRDINRVVKYMRRKRLEAAMKLFLLKRQEYLPCNMNGLHANLGSSDQEIELCEWFGSPMYYALLSSASFTAYPDEESFCARFNAEIASLPSNLQSLVRRHSNTVAEPNTMVDTSPSDHIVTMRTILGFQRPHWNINNTRVLRESSWVDLGVL
eukprot:CFRG0978T1